MSGISKRLFEDSDRLNPYFQKDEQGRDVYFPWGYVGDAYYVSRQQKFILRVISYIFTLIALVLFFLLEELYPDYPLFGCAIFMTNMILFMWVTFFLFYEKKITRVKQRSLLSQTHNRQPRVVRSLFFLMLVQVLIALMGFSMAPSDPLLKIAVILVVVLYPFFIWFVWRRQGYIFQKKPSFEKDSE